MALDLPGDTSGSVYSPTRTDQAAGQGSLYVSLAAGAIVAFMAFSLSMAFRRRFRGDGIAFYVILLALMTPGFLLGLGTQIFWKSIGSRPRSGTPRSGRTRSGASRSASS